MSVFINHLTIGELEQLELYDIDLAVQDAIELVERNRRTIKKIFLKTINIARTENDMPYPSWSRMRMAMELFSNDCEVEIDTLMDHGDKEDMALPWIGWSRTHSVGKGSR